MKAPDTDPRWQAPRSEGASSTPAARRHDPLLVRIVFVLTLVGAVVLAFEPQRKDEGAEAWVLRVAIAAGAAVACVGILVPWWRIGALARRLHPPGPQLASVSRLLGWLALGALPAVALRAPWWVNPIVATLPFAALALWQRRPWSALYWYAAALAALGSGLWRLWSTVQPILERSDEQPLGAYATGGLVGRVIGGLMLVALAFVIARDTRAFQRSLPRT